MFRGDHSPNTRTLGVWVNEARRSASKSRSGSRNSARKTNASPAVRRTLIQNSAATLPQARYTEYVTYDEPVDITLNVPKKSVKKTLTQSQSSQLLVPGKRMREVGR
jgi:hypothetical protein